MIRRACACAREGGAIKQTAIFHTHFESGATLVDHHGWQIPSSFSAPGDEAASARASVGIADVSWMSKFELQGHGLKEPPVLEPVAHVWLLGRLRYLVTCLPSSNSTVQERIRQAAAAWAPAAPVYLTDVTSVYTHLLLAGPRSREVLSKLTSLNLSERGLGNLTCAQANLAHVHALVLRKDMKGLPAYHVLVSREYGESAWESVLHAGHEFGITPFGLQAEQLLQG